MPRWQKILGALMIIGAVVAFFLEGLPRLREADTCATGVVKSHGECIGVNGDGYDFGTPEIRDVARAIADQNRRIGHRPSVTVAVMLPLQSGNAAARRQMRSDLQGAYLGQREANQGKGEPPKIRLVLANPGRDYGQQARVVDRLLPMAHASSRPLRAVTGFNLSLDATREAVKRLTQHHIAVLASRISSETIANQDRPDGTTAPPKYPGLARIIPTNRDAARALASFSNSAARENGRTIVVYDTRPKDSYNESLTKAFNGIREKGAPGPAAMSFQSPDIDAAGDVGNQFNIIANNICDTGADVVYFAGRAMHLRLFALRLAQNSCGNRHYTIISGSDAASLRQGMSRHDWSVLRGPGGQPKVAVQYAAPAHPDAWRDTLAAWDRAWQTRHHRKPTDNDRPRYLTEPRDALAALRNLIANTRRDGVRLGPVDLGDSRTMLVYDGLVTIGTALHQAQDSGTTAVPGLQNVGQQWGKLQSRHRVRGTSGWICLTNGGNAYDKPVAVVELDPGPAGGGTLRFLGLGWPAGHPQPRNCVIPSRSP